MALRCLARVPAPVSCRLARRTPGTGGTVRRRRFAGNVARSVSQPPARLRDRRCLRRRRGGTHRRRHARDANDPAEAAAGARGQAAARARARRPDRRRGRRAPARGRSLRPRSAASGSGDLPRYHSLEARGRRAFAAWPGRLRRAPGARRGPPAERRRPAELRARPLLATGRHRCRTSRGEPHERRSRTRHTRCGPSDLLHPDFPRGLPTFVPSFPAPPGAGAALAAEAARRRSRRAARTGGARDKLLYGVALQRLGRQLSALREYQAAAALAPPIPSRKVAVAVARFDKAEPALAFSRLGPLAGAIRRARACASTSASASCGWAAGRGEDGSCARRAAGPRTTLGVEARRFLERLASVRCGQAGRLSRPARRHVRPVCNGAAFAGRAFDGTQVAARLSALTGGATTRWAGARPLRSSGFRCSRRRRRAICSRPAGRPAR